MSYRYEQETKSIVIEGFENGVANDPYSGLADLRNIDIITVPGEGSVAFAPSATTTQPPLAAKSVAVSNSGGNILFTWTAGAGETIANGTAILVSGSVIPTGLTANRPYYVVNLSGSTFNLAPNYGGTPVAYTNTGTAVTFSTIDMAEPRFMTVSFSTDIATSAVTYLYFLVDTNGRVWYYYQGSQWVYLNNMNGDESNATTEGGNGLVAWKRYLMWFRPQQVGYLQILDASYNPQTIAIMTTYTNWNRTWKSLTASWLFTNVPTSISHEALVHKTDDSVYFCNINAVGTILQNAGSTFDPTSASTYTFNGSALNLPVFEVAKSIGQLNTNILVGGVADIVYQWDRVSVGYYPIPIAENGVYKIIGTNTNAYFFAGRRGRIYISNGSQAQLFKKIPDHISGTVTPYYVWGGANVTRNQLYFGVKATDNAGTAINQYGGTWGIDLDTKAMRLVSESSYNTYAGYVSSIISILGDTATSDGYGILTGWNSGASTYGVDKSTNLPYVGGQSYVISDLIPVGTYNQPQNFTNIEFKLSQPLVAGESIQLLYRLNGSDNFATIGTWNTAGMISERKGLPFKNAQWLQIQAIITSTASTPSYVRLRQIRIQ